MRVCHTLFACKMPPFIDCDFNGNFLKKWARKKLLVCEKISNVSLKFKLSLIILVSIAYYRTMEKTAKVLYATELESYQELTLK